MKNEEKSKNEISIITVVMLALLILSALVLLYVSTIKYQNNVASKIENQQQVITDNGN